MEKSVGRIGIINSYLFSDQFFFQWMMIVNQPMACLLTALTILADGPFNNNSPDAESTRPNRRFFTLRITERMSDTNIKFSVNRNWVKYCP